MSQNSFNLKLQKSQNSLSLSRLIRQLAPDRHRFCRYGFETEQNGAIGPSADEINHECLQTVPKSKTSAIPSFRFQRRDRGRYMPISTRSSKEELLFFSDPTRLERSIRKEKRAASIDTNSSTSIATYHRATIDTSRWLKQLPPGSLTSWTDIHNAFVPEFFGEARAQEIRDKIWIFSQGPIEAFKRSLERFMRYQRDCPHHGFTEVQLLKKFYKGIDVQYRVMLDTESEGNFETRTKRKLRD
ncbi:PREDICTED: uncharacterized protein LOC106302550 [Brassica oleracea var. oleracea]|uniref:uncharacterized protein LOC106302550 n=1 Tax=Brassica oleracea var. oleracea TaxID=109376 RepID=UPI0006A70E91|nr:PREDICTED: uncharacterized protein LOC106302550 [Brassica oleracea var. oleracea]